MLLGLRGVGRWIAIAWVLGASACGGDEALGAGGEGDDDTSSGDDEGTGDPAGIDAQIEAFVATRCEQASACDCAGTFGSDDCVEAGTAVWEARIAAAGDRELTRDEACLAANLATLETAGCRWPSAVLAGGAHLCSEFCAVWHGDKAMGEACEAYDPLVSDCAQGLLCDAGTCVDPCTRLTGLPLGDTCSAEQSGEFEDCATGSWCDYDTRACVPFAQESESCTGNACAESLFCDWQSNTCKSAGAAGDPCADSYCQDDLYCDWSATNPTCRARGLAGQSCASVPCADGFVCGDASVCVEPPPAGQPCASGACAEGALCDWEVNACVALPVVGQPCPYGECGSGAWCDASVAPDTVCASLVANGEACTGHSQCESGYCPRGFCEARPSEGEDCSVLFICERGLVCNGSTCQPTSFRGPAACVYPGW